MTRASLARSVLGVALALASASCDEIVDDSSFQLWCGDVPCEWTIEEGSVARAPTWHDDDYGVSLVADPTAISQLVPNRRLYQGCIRFELISYVEKGSELRLELDFEDDGTRELDRTLDRANWNTDVFYVGSPPGYGSVRIRLVKYGPGRAIVAQLRAQGVPSDEGCLGPSL
ncbi:MAG: hypothetical protein U0230_17525 [Polyangiales bacterium]